MGNFRSNTRGGFGGRSGGNRFGGRSEGFRDRNSGFERRPTEMYDAVCAKCGKDCQVPFKPSGDKPVLCSDCFRKEGNSGGNFGSRNQGSQSGISSEQFNQLNVKLDKILQTLQDLEVDVEDDVEDDLEDDLDEDSENDSKKDS